MNYYFPAGHTPGKGLIMWFIILGLGAVGVGYAVKEHKAKEAAEAYAASEHAAALAAQQQLADYQANNPGARDWSRSPRPLMGYSPPNRRARGHYAHYDGSGNYRRG